MTYNAASPTAAIVSDAEAAKVSFRAQVAELEADTVTVANSLEALDNLVSSAGHDANPNDILELLRAITFVAKGLAPRMLSIANQA